MMTMKSANFSALLALLAVISYAASASGTSLNTSNGTLRVAIVGAGVAGASTAYHLRSMYGESSTISITILKLQHD
jgi:threonine dehydrogenase-like Zn-dependent dehydrogenase